MEVTDLTQEYKESVEAAAKRGEPIEFFAYFDPDVWIPFPNARNYADDFNWKHCYFRVAKPEKVMDSIKEAQEIIEEAIGMVETMLSEREKTHGNFRDHARCTQRLKAVLRDELEIVGKALTMEQQEALDMIFHKIGRMVAGDANFIDHWDDSAGYSTLVAKVLRGEL